MNATSLSALPAPRPVLSGGVTLSVRRFGQGPRAVMIHGGPGLDHHTLLPLAVRLASHLEIWLPDLPGHGAMAGSADRPPGLRQIQERLARWLKGLEPPLILIGHSLGAWLLAQIVRQQEIRPAALILISPPVSGQSPTTTPVRRAGRITGNSSTGPATAVARRDFIAHLAGETREDSDEMLEAVRSAAIRDPAAYGALLAHLHRALTRPLRPFDPHCPALVVAGERDRTTLPSDARRLAGVIRDATMVEIEDAGHYPFAGQPDRTAEAVLSFLDRTLGGHR